MERADLEPIVGWKAIGAALGVSERTARRYERQLGLPVRRLARGGQPRVYRSQLAEWERRRAAAVQVAEDGRI